MGWSVSHHQPDVAPELGASNAVLRLSGRHSQGDLYHQRGRVAEYELAQGDQNPGLVPLDAVSVGTGDQFTCAVCCWMASGSQSSRWPSGCQTATSKRCSSSWDRVRGSGKRCGSGSLGAWSGNWSRMRYG